MGKNEKWSSSVNEGQLNGLFDKGCSFEGKLNFNGIMQVNGQFTGDIISDGTLVVGPDARIQANVKVDTIIIDGCVEGDVEAKTKIELRSNGKLMASVSTKSLVIEDGGVFHGTSRASGESANKTSDKKQDKPHLEAVNAK